LTIFFLIPEFLLNRKAGWFVVLFLLIGVALSALKLMVSDQIFYATLSPENIQRHGLLNLRFVVVNTKDMTFIVALFCIAKFVKDFFHAEKARKLLQKETFEAKRKLYQTQFDPHFLFNTINNLYAISLLNPEKAIQVVGRLKTVLHYIIDEIQKDFVALESEIVLVKNYIQLEKLRYGNRLKIDFIIDGNPQTAKIPPMILFFLIENSFRHGSSLDAGSPWIHINIKPENGKIHLRIENSKPLNTNNFKGRNLPLSQLRKRLDVIYSRDGYDLKIDETDKSFSVNLELR
jgi:LytS/YehU family sensor histidine kinase